MGTEEHEINRKRKIDIQDYQISRDVEEEKNDFLTFSKDSEENKNDLLTLSLCPSINSARFFPGKHAPPSPRPPRMPHSMGDEVSQPHISLSIRPPPPPSVVPNGRYRQPVSSGSSNRVRRKPSQLPREGKSATVPAPFPWASNQRATLHSLTNLLSKHIYTISGDVQCKKCEQKYQMEYDLQRKFFEVGKFIA
ncbi:unnamed protein product [Fraxinus pennsylvanica]|uniref:DUF7086 domain-containing protein n=1 Tax=Fraxinus pennsylvanica TaxID=56036 RepID=A0AAD2AHS7_9LAMI|nr:unnamed protein product [Fraxinus pennsylvanica]